MRNCKLLQINTSLNWSATGKIAEQIATLAQSVGWDCYVAHGARYVSGKSVAKDISTDCKLNDYLDAAMTMVSGYHGLGSKYVTQRLVKQIDRISPAIIHLHNIHGYYLNYQILFDYLSQSNAKVVWTLHDCWAMTGHCTHFDSIGCEKWKTRCHDCPLLHVAYKSLFFDRSEENYTKKKSSFTSVGNMTIVPVSNWLGNIVAQSFLKDYPRQVIYNGVDLEVFKPTENHLRQEYSIGNNRTVVLGVASAWGNGKGLDEFSQLSKTGRYQVVLVGVSEKVKKQLPPSIIAIKRTQNQRELAEYYSMADVFVNPTHNDSFPTVNLEALACGTPVVTYRTGGSPEAVDEQTGVVVETGNFGGLVEAIDFISSRRKNDFAFACRKRAEQCFNKEDCFMDYIKLYQQLLSQSSELRSY